MPVLKKDFRLTKEINLPSYPDAKVVIFNSMTTRESDEMVNLDKDPKPSNLLRVLPKLIKSWNFTDDNETVLEINEETLNLFAQEDLIYIANQIKEFNEGVKKK